MAGGFQNMGKDSFDITELASLNDEISDDMIEQLEQQLTEKLNLEKQKDAPPVNENDDTTLFEETNKETPEGDAAAPEESSAEKVEGEASEKTEATETTETTEGAKPETDAEKAAQAAKTEKKEINQSFDDNFIKKYKAKLKNKAQGGGGDKGAGASYGGVAPGEDEPLDNNMKDRSSGKGSADEEGDIAALSQGKITERSLSGDQKSYNDSLDFLDKNVKYSKYVIYIDPQNVDYIEGLTVKERKNLINGILRQQDDIAITKLRFKVIQTIIRHALITLLTIAIAIPVVYSVINASLEATINNHRSAQTNWQALYKEHGKITQN